MSRGSAREYKRSDYIISLCTSFRLLYCWPSALMNIKTVIDAFLKLASVFSLVELARCCSLAFSSARHGIYANLDFDVQA
jgi:hypothetical protein